MQLANQLRNILEEVRPQLLAMSNVSAVSRPAPEKWAPIEILGHLIDSANNNHARFVRSVAQPNLVFPGYAQNDWVGTQRYRAADWENTVQLWYFYNQHIAHVFTQLPTELVHAERNEHSFDTMAWEQVPADKPSTLFHLMADYVGHLEHHIRQILPGYEPQVIGTY